MGKHLADRRNGASDMRVKYFLRIARKRREGWHRTGDPVQGNRRIVEFLRIARGRTA